MLGSNDQTMILKTLTSTLNDSVNGYRDAADNAEGSQFQQIFRDNADERARVAGELQSEVRRLGGTPDEDGTIMGKTHQAFLDLKAAVTGRDDKAIINEVERGEDYLKEKFEAALADDKLTGESREIVERAYQSVRKGHDQISQLKHGLEA
ncbi:MAG: PA2169 family four-helix-bundle protein [Sphingomonas bacterium]|nr:PA2169 family four-helix-bundle protein [Sphingomonas bacterium]